jgi:hypothetical protein
LNSYVETSQTIPGSLRQAGVKSVPKTISYQKLSSSSYKFCVTYKGTSSGFDAPGVVNNLMTGSSDMSSGGLSDNSDNNDLYISTTYYKGVNCQTVKSGIVPPTTSTSTARSSTGTQSLCGYGAQIINGCLTRCSTPTQNTAELIIDGTVTTVSNTNSSSMLFTVKDTKNALHQVSITNSTTFYDSSCTPTDPYNIQVGGKVRVIVDGSVVYPGGVNDHVLATEVDDLSL